MHRDLDRTLCERYPYLFARRHDPTSCMAEGFSCRDGWFHLIDVLCQQLQAETDRRGAPQLAVRQVKQKFGELRFSVGTDAAPRQRAMLELTRALSLRTCEICGAPGWQHRDEWNWIQTRCDAHCPPASLEQQPVLNALAARFQRRLASLREPGAGQSLRAVIREPAYLDGQVFAGDAEAVQQISKRKTQDSSESETGPCN